jgi:hypothetical protein
MEVDRTERKIGRHVVTVERMEKLRWRVSVDGRNLPTFCSKARACEAGRLEARLLDAFPVRAALLAGPSRPR